MNCSKCGAPLNEGSTFCGVCGTPVNPQSTPVAPVATPEAPAAPVAEAPVTPVTPEVAPTPVEQPAAPVVPAEPVVTPAEPVLTPETPAVTPVEPVVAPVTPEVPVQPVVAPEAPIAQPVQPEVPVQPVTPAPVQPAMDGFSSQGVVPPQGPGLQQQMMGTPIVPMQPQKKDNKFMIIIIAMILVIVVLGVIAFGDKIGINIGGSDTKTSENKKDDSKEKNNENNKDDKEDKEDKKDDKEDIVASTGKKYSISGINVLIPDNIKVSDEGEGMLSLSDGKTFQSVIQLIPGNIDELKYEMDDLKAEMDEYGEIITKTYGSYKTMYFEGTMSGKNVDFGIMDIDGTAVMMFLTVKTARTSQADVFKLYSGIIDSIFATNSFADSESNIGNNVQAGTVEIDTVEFEELEEE